MTRRTLFNFGHFNTARAVYRMIHWTSKDLQWCLHHFWTQRTFKVFQNSLLSSFIYLYILQLRFRQLISVCLCISVSIWEILNCNLEASFQDCFFTLHWMPCFWVHLTFGKTYSDTLFSLHLLVDSFATKQLTIFDCD